MGAGINATGVAIGAVSFIIIGLFHPIVIAVEYRLGKRAWPAFLVTGLISCAASLMVPGAIASSCLGVLGFTCLWSIRELFEQEERVNKGWFPRNPKRDGGLK
jgi:hypothetical protein